MSGRNRRGISLRGYNYNRNNSISLKGFNFNPNNSDLYEIFEDMILNSIHNSSNSSIDNINQINKDEYYENIIAHIRKLPEDFMNLKLYLIDNFLIPLAQRKFDHVNQNYYNIDWLLGEVDKLDYPHLEEEIEFFKRVIEIMQYAATTQLTFDGLKTKLYGRRFGITIETSRVVLQAPYEVYVILFGNPTTKGRIFSKKRIKDIKYILQKNPGILTDDIREKLSIKYYRYFTDYHKEQYKIVHPKWEYESNSDSDSGAEDKLEEDKETTKKENNNNKDN